MQYRFLFREITQADLDKHCPFMPDEHEFEMHLIALSQEALWLQGVTEAHRDGSHAVVVTTDETLEEIKDRFIPLLQNHWAHLRISSVAPHDVSQA